MSVAGILYFIIAESKNEGIVISRIHLGRYWYDMLVRGYNAGNYDGYEKVGSQERYEGIIIVTGDHLLKTHIGVE